MSDDSVQKPISEGGSSQTPPQEQAKDERADSQHNDMSTPNADGDIKPKPILLSVLLFAGCEALGYMCSDIAEGLEGYIAMVVHWIALCCSAAGFFAAWHEMVEGKKVCKIWTIYGSVCVALAVVACLVWLPQKTLATNPEVSKPVVPEKSKTESASPPLKPRNGFVGDTEFTYPDLDEAFPFGYVVFRKDAGKHIFEAEPNNHLKTIIDWSEVVISPDFDKKTVGWYVPHIDSYLSNEAQPNNVGINNIEGVSNVPMVVGHFYRMEGAFYAPGEPEIVVATLSDNPLHPIFVLGFKIISSYPERQPTPR